LGTSTKDDVSSLHSQKGITADTEPKLNEQVGIASKNKSSFAHFDENYCYYCMLQGQKHGLAAI
jgi:hypothetical protein